MAKVLIMSEAVRHARERKLPENSIFLPHRKNECPGINSGAMEFATAKEVEPDAHLCPLARRNLYPKGKIMMQANEVRQGFSRAEQCIRQAADACRSANTISMDLKDSIQALDQQLEQAREVVMQSNDEARVRDCVDELEELGDRAKSACERDPGVGAEVKQAVMQTHQELSSLKHQVH
jgi:hypothetical protein